MKIVSSQNVQCVVALSRTPERSSHSFSLVGYAHEQDVLEFCLNASMAVVVISAVCCSDNGTLEKTYVIATMRIVAKHDEQAAVSYMKAQISLSSRRPACVVGEISTHRGSIPRPLRSSRALSLYPSDVIESDTFELSQPKRPRVSE